MPRAVYLLNDRWGKGDTEFSMMWSWLGQRWRPASSGGESGMCSKYRWSETHQRGKHRSTSVLERSISLFTIRIAKQMHFCQTACYPICQLFLSSSSAKQRWRHWCTLKAWSTGLLQMQGVKMLVVTQWELMLPGVLKSFKTEYWALIFLVPIA